MRGVPVCYCCLHVCLICPLKFGLRYIGSGNATQWRNTFVILKNTFLLFYFTPFVIILSISLGTPKIFQAYLVSTWSNFPMLPPVVYNKALFKLFQNPEK